MEYENIGFNADKVKQYEAARKAMNYNVGELKDFFSFFANMSF